MKKYAIWAFLLIFALSAVLVGCQDTPEPTPTPPAHVCNHKCDLCGGCKDASCNEPECTNKCPGHDTPAPQPKITVSASVSELTLKREEVATYDFCGLFYIFSGTEQIAVTTEYLSPIETDKDEFTLTCTYKGVSASVKVILVDPVVQVIASSTQITLTGEQALTYDYLSLFTAIEDGKVITLTVRNLTSNVTSAPGTYQITATYKNASATVAVVVRNQVTVKATRSPKIKDTEVATYDFCQLFFITRNGKSVEVLKQYLDLSGLTQAGVCRIYCTYEGVTGYADVEIVPTVYSVTSTTDRLTIHYSAVQTYDFTSIFSASVDGVPVTVTTDMLSGNIEAKAGEYQLTATCGKASKTITVVVAENHDVQVIPAFTGVVLNVDEVADFDFTSLFWLYVDGRSAQVTVDMVDSSSVLAQIGEYSVVLRFRNDTRTDEFTVKVTVSDKDTVTIVCHDAVVYPNGEKIDLTTLFTVTDNGKEVQVTLDMISGSVDYAAEGENEITLTYKGKTYVAKVEVRRGVTITPKSDVIKVLVGTDKRYYDFSSDFVVSVNGLRFENLSAFLDVSAVDFSIVGEYSVTLTVKYNQSAPTLAGSNFTETSATVIYKVVANVSEVTVIEGRVTYSGAGNFDPTANLRVVINGYDQSFTDRADYADVLTCYYKVLSGVDESVTGVQTVRIALYVDGPDAEPTIVEYEVLVFANVEIKVFDKVVFVGDTLYPSDLFTITENGQVLPFDASMISGKVDLFTAGKYVLTVQYKGISQTVTVSVLDRSLLGTYKTSLTTIPKEGFEDEEGYVDEGVAGKAIGDMIISREGIIVDGKIATILSVTDVNHMQIVFGGYEYKLTYEDGIGVLIPLNPYRMSYSDSMRALVYFNANVYDAGVCITLNSGSESALTSQVTCTTVFITRLTQKDSGARVWYGLSVRVNYVGSDYTYTVGYGKAILPSDVIFKSDATFQMTFDNVLYDVKMSAVTVGKISAVDNTSYEWQNTRFTGVVDGKNAILKFGKEEAVTFTVGNVNMVTNYSVYKLGSYDSNAYLSRSAGELFVYKYRDAFYSYKFSIDAQNNTFTLLAKDKLFGLYRFGNSLIFLDGYGSGHVEQDVDKHSPVPITYRQQGNEVVLTFLKYQKQYGNEAVLQVAELLNVLTVKDWASDSYVGARFVNEYIQDGAIVTIDNLEYIKGKAKTEIYDCVTVVTKDGTYTGTTLKNKKVVVNGKSVPMLDVSTIGINNDGFHRFTITVQVDGKPVVGYYALRVLEDRYSANTDVIGKYTSVSSSSFSFELDKYGRATVISGESKYQGYVVITDDAFLIVATDGNGNRIVGKGLMMADNIAKVAFDGAFSVNEIFTSVSGTVWGTDGVVIRKYGSVYLYSKSAFGISQIVTITDIGNGDFAVHTDGGDVIVRFLAENDITSGLAVADDTRGTYTDGQGNTLVLDGFGKATIGGVSYDCENNARNTVVFERNGELVVYQINRQAKTFAVYELQLDAKYFAGLEVAAKHSYTCTDYSYSANTTMLFFAGGKVAFASTSDGHDDDVENNCGKPYVPAYKDSEGTFAVNGRIITVEIGGQTFTFRVNDVVMPTKLTCVSTTMTATDHGYFQVGTVFSVNA